MYAQNSGQATRATSAFRVRTSGTHFTISHVRAAATYLAAPSLNMPPTPMRMSLQSRPVTWAASVRWAVTSAASASVDGSLPAAHFDATPVMSNRTTSVPPRTALTTVSTGGPFGVSLHGATPTTSQANNVAITSPTPVSVLATATPAPVHGPPILPGPHAGSIASASPAAHSGAGSAQAPGGSLIVAPRRTRRTRRLR